jgi:outer membrane protein OmpA-like peptidoglycan-associated protein
MAMAIFALACIASFLSAASDPEDRPGSKEHPLFTRMPDYFIGDYSESEFARYQFKDKNGTPIPVDGNLYKATYSIKKGKTRATALQIIRNYSNAVEKIGGLRLFEDDNNAYYAIKKSGMETWAHVYARNVGYYTLAIVEKREMEQDVIADAAQMARDIHETGKVALYGIYFDSDKSEIKAESEPALLEIVKFLRENPAMKIYVVGHTDSDGSLEHNRRLSEARARSVVQELTVKHGIAAARLDGYGVGPLCPVRSNKSEAGKARNRRVELVEQ